MNKQVVLVERRGEAALVTLNRPEAMNALSIEVINELSLIFQELQQDESVAAVILTGNGRAFSAGLDLKQLGEMGLPGFLKADKYDVKSIILGFDRPIIGAINGVAATGGFELALMCDLLIATPEARFIDSHARVGLIPGWGLSQRLQRLIGVNRARELHFTGNALSAEKAELWGVVNRIVSDEQLIPTCEELAAEMASCDRNALIGLKRVVNEGGAMPLSSALEYENFAMHLYGETQSPEDLLARRGKVQARGKAPQ